MRHLQLMIKPASSNCNLRCAYCFYEDECKNREIPSYGLMTLETLEAVVKKALEETQELYDWLLTLLQTEKRDSEE